MSEKLKVRKGFMLVVIVVLLVVIGWGIRHFNHSARSIGSNANEIIQDIQENQEKRKQALFDVLAEKDQEIANIRRETPSIKSLQDENAALQEELKGLKSTSKPTTLEVCLTQKKQYQFALEECVEKHTKAVRGNEMRETIIAAKNFQLAGWGMFYAAQEVDFLSIDALRKTQLKKEKKKKLIWSLVAFGMGFLAGEVL
ncbi:MAG: hypothetical protein KAW12_13390 [Candidatus Aminicenantes bacterium]|nr:hypothetical protein [Candidatus Aminicenantes bacterium]